MVERTRRFTREITQERQCAYVVTLKRVRATVVVVEKQQVLHIPSVCVALVIQRVIRMRRIVICDLSQYTLFFHIIL